MARKGSIRPDVAFRYLTAGRKAAAQNFGIYFTNKDNKTVRKQASEFCRTKEDADRVKKRLEDLNPGQKIIIKDETTGKIMENKNQLLSRIDKILFEISEASGQKTKIKNLAGLVKVLQSSDFGMSKAGGNGYAMNKGGKLVLHDPFWISPRGPELERKRNDWLEGGTYYNYFRDEYGITFGNVKVETILDHKKYGPNSGGYTQLTVDVIFGIKESLNRETDMRFGKFINESENDFDSIQAFLKSAGFKFTYTPKETVFKKDKMQFDVDDNGAWGYKRTDGPGNYLTQGKGLAGIKKIVKEK
jgi:hypothetical protein